MSIAFYPMVMRNRCGNATLGQFITVNDAVRAITASEIRAVTIKRMSEDGRSHG